jgi:hydrogenase maturation protease
MNVLRTVKRMGGASNKILIVGCEPADLGTDEEGKLGLSEPVAAAVHEAADLIETLVSKALDRERVETVSEEVMRGC